MRQVTVYLHKKRYQKLGADFDKKNQVEVL